MIGFLSIIAGAIALLLEHGWIGLLLLAGLFAVMVFAVALRR